MRRAILMLSLAALTACASLGVAEYDGVEYIPLVQITNANLFDAGVFLNGRKIADVSGPNGDVLVKLRQLDVSGARVLSFTYKLQSTGAVYALAPVQYAGRKLHVQIAEHAQYSTAW